MGLSRQQQWENERRAKARREEHERRMALARLEPNVIFPKTDLLDRMKKISKDRWLLCSECYSKDLSKETLARKTAFQNKLLEKELELINLKIETFRPEWIIDDFDKYLFNYLDESKERKLICAKIRDKKTAKKLERIAGELHSNKNYGIRLDYGAFGSTYIYVNKELDKQKLFDLIRGYIFFGNTQKKLKIKEQKEKYKGKNIFITLVTISVLIALVALLMYYIQ